MDQGTWGQTGSDTPTVALTPGAAGPGRCNHSWWPGVGHATDQDTPGPERGGGTSGQQRTGAEGHLVTVRPRRDPASGQG